MYPRLFEFGPFTIYTYGVLLAAAFLLGLKLATARARRRGLDAGRILDLGIYIIVAAILGGKLLLLVTDFSSFRANPAEILSLARSGGVFYGGLLLAVAVSFWYMRRHRLPLWSTCDVFAPGIALGHAVGRLGCLMAGCCYGKPTGGWWAITFSDAFTGDYVGTPLGTPLHPTQLYEVGAELAILAFLLWLERRPRQFPGRTFWSYILLYGVSRYAIEFFRGDPRGAVWIFSTSQFISVLLVPASVLMLARLAGRTRAAGAAAGTASTPGAPSKRGRKAVDGA
jgi:phosphatidylglycerol:prolipoprotein diacylglycerol transferase